MRKVLWGVGVFVAAAALCIGGFLGYANATWKRRLTFADVGFPTHEVPRNDPAMIERGRYLVHGPAHCASCHSTDDRDRPALVKTAPLSGGLSFDMGPIGTRYAKNLTPDVETGIGARTDAELLRTLRTGVLHTGELSFFMWLAGADLSDEDAAAVVAYLRSMAPIRKAVPEGSWGLLGKAMLTTMTLAPRSSQPVAVQAQDVPSVERGAYLVDHVALCAMCHTATDQQTFQAIGPKAGGGLPEPSHGKDTDMEFATPNLTSDPTGYTGKVSEEEFIARLRSGRTIVTSIMPWENFQSMTESDMRSVYRYLRALPPVHNEVGPSYRKIGSHPAP